MRSYPEYKDSGIEWLGEIPKHWEILKQNVLILKNLKKVVLVEKKERGRGE